jgi:hypothetical protein
MTQDKPLYAYYDDSLFCGKIKHERDEGKFEADFNNFVNSRFAKGRIVLIDSKVEELDFKIPRHYEDIFICPLNDCLRYLAGSVDKFLCLALGTSVSFPRMNLDRITAKEVYLAEIHACCYGILGEAASSIEYSRISLFRIDGAAKSRARIARYEKNKEILEDSLNPGEELMDPANYSSVGAWMRDGRAEYQIIPLPLCHAVTQIEKKRGLKWPESYYFLQNAGAAISEEGVHVYNLAGDKLWMDEKDEPDQNDDPKDGTI